MALSLDRTRERMGESLLVPVPVGDAERIYQGAIVISLLADGYGIPGDDVAAAVFRGVAVEPCDNSAGADGAKSVLCDLTSAVLVNGTGFTVADVGKDAYIIDDDTVGLVGATTNDIKLGRIIRFVSSTQVWVLPVLA